MLPFSLSARLPFSLSMMLTHQQLAAITARAFPGDSLREASQAAPGCYALRLAGGDRLYALIYTTPEEAHTASAALRMVRAEFDLPLPQLRAADEAGETVGVPYTLVSGIEGQALAEVRDQIPDGQIYAIGQQLGEAAQRIHRLSAPHFGPLIENNGSADEGSYASARLEHGLAGCRQAGLLNNATVETIRNWFSTAFQPVGKGAALVHGNLGPQTILVKRVGANWKLGGITGWERAVGWVPAWEHTNLFEATGAMTDFSLRVGYGNAYDERTQRTYEQVRDIAMLPYRALLLLEYITDKYAAGDTAGATRARNALLGMVEL